GPGPRGLRAEAGRGADRLGAVREQRLGPLLLGGLAARVLRVRMADVREGERRATDREQAAQRERVTVVVGVVVGDDDLGGHFSHLWFGSASEVRQQR